MYPIKPYILKPTQTSNLSGVTDTQIQKLVHTRGLWGNSVAKLLTFYTSSAQNTDSKEYYYEVWSSSSLDCEDARMFSVAYGHVSGSGSLNDGGQISDTPTRAVYSQYKLSCLDGDETGFKLQGETSPISHFYAININRDKFGDKLDPGNFQLSLSELNGGIYANNVYTGSNVAVSGSKPKIVSLIDDSKDEKNNYEYTGRPSLPRNLVSGTLADGIYNPSAPHYYGLVYPDRGVILLDADKVNTNLSFNSVTGSNLYGDNAYKLFTSISGAAATTNATTNEGFTARAVEVKNQHYVFVRINNDEYNYSNNPTYVTSSTNPYDQGSITEQSFIEYPYSYITTIGLYNNDEELVAVGKLSKPILKSFTSELSITVKLEY